jgi:hypothetical protein
VTRWFDCSDHHTSSVWFAQQFGELLSSCALQGVACLSGGKEGSAAAAAANLFNMMCALEYLCSCSSFTSPCLVPADMLSCARNCHFNETWNFSLKSAG